MEKVIKDAICAIGGTTKMIVLTVLILVSAILLNVALNYPAETIAVIVIGVVICRTIIDFLHSPSPIFSSEQIIEATIAFLDDAYRLLKDKMIVFDGVSGDDVPLSDGSGYQKFLRWRWHLLTMGGVPVVRLGLLRLKQATISPEDLALERRTLQNLMVDSLCRNLVPYFPPVFSDGTPSLVLINIVDDGAYIYFDFVCVQDATSSAFVHQYGLPPNGDDTDDQDF